MRKLIVRLFNIIFLAFSAISLVMIFTKPIIDIGVNIPMPTDLIYDAMHKEEEGGKTEKIILRDSSSEGSSSEEIMDKITKEDLEECLGDVKLQVSVSIPSPFKYDYKDEKAINTLIKDSIDATVESNIEPITTGFKKLVKKVAGTVASDAITSAIKDEIAKNAKGEDVEAIFEEYGIEEDVDNLVDTVFEKMEEGVTPAQLAETISEESKAIAQKLADGGVEGFEGVTEFDTTEIEEQMTKMFDEAGLIDPETGKIMNIDQALIMLLDSIPLGDDSSNPEQNTETTEQVITKKLGVKLSDAAEDEEELNQKVKDLVDGLLVDIKKSIDELEIPFSEYIQYAFYGLLALMAFPWALLLLITFIRTLRKKKCWTKPWVVFFFGSLQLVFGIGLTVAASKLLPTLTNSLVSESSNVSSLIGGASLLIKTGVYVPSILYLVMIPLTIAYMIVAHKVKKEFKQYKKEKKLAKKAA